MKKSFAVLMAVLFLGSTTGMVLAQGTTPESTPVAKVAPKGKKAGKHSKGKKGHKKSTAAPVAASTTPTK